MNLSEVYWKLTLSLLKAKGLDPAPEWSVGCGICGSDALYLRPEGRKDFNPRVILPKIVGNPLYLIYGERGLWIFPGEQDAILVGEVEGRYEPADGVDQSEIYPEFFERIITRKPRVWCAETFDLGPYDWIQDLLAMLS